ncbi:hypothetical protein BDF14DRAFT_1834143 [Spinellus fusiger]|nr:hypothetical protein BDF14DRAFT_1834143 [Spinellus fusiger]
MSISIPAVDPDTAAEPTSPNSKNASAYRPRQTATVRARAQHAKTQQLLYEEEKRKAALAASRSASRSVSRPRPKPPAATATTTTAAAHLLAPAKDPIKVERRKTMPSMPSTPLETPKREPRSLRK